MKGLAFVKVGEAWVRADAIESVKPTGSNASGSPRVLVRTPTTDYYGHGTAEEFLEDPEVLVLPLDP